MAADTLTIYLKKLGVEPGATLEEINAAYYRLIESVAENGSEQDAQRMLDLQHAYAVVRRAYEGDDVRERREAHLRSARTRRVVRATGVLGGALAILLLLFNFSGLRMAFGGFEPGDVIRWEHEEVPYGRILRYDPEHRFRIGEPVGAYEILRHGTNETVWLSERVVDKAMVEVDAPAISQAGPGSE